MNPEIDNTVVSEFRPMTDQEKREADEFFMNTIQAGKESENDEKLRMWRDKSIIGREVRIGGKTRTVVGVYQDVKGGIWLNKPVAGSRSWNVSDLAIVTKK